MMGVFLLWMGSLILAFVADSVFDVRLTLRAVEQAEQSARDEQAVRSLTESFARLLQLDPDRAQDSLEDAWASFEPPRDGAYEGLWPEDIEVAVHDCERSPPDEMIDLALSGKPAGRSGNTPKSPGAWLNILTADARSWEALGFSGRSSVRLVEKARRDNGQPIDLLAIPELASRETRVLQRLVAEGLLKTRSEYYLLTCRLDETTFESLLYREPGRGEIRLVRLRCMGESDRAR